MSRDLEEAIIGLIEDYRQNGLRVHATVRPDTPDGQLWVSLADSDSAPWIAALNHIGDCIDGASVEITNEYDIR